MTPIVLDFESYFTKDYSLKKLSTSEYVRDPRFDLHGGSILSPLTESAPTYYWPGSCPGELNAALLAIDWPNTLLIAHNAKFEAFILHTYYKIHPGRIFCTKDAINGIFQGAIRAGLDDVSKRFGLPPKPHNIKKFRDLRVADLDATQRQELAEYCNSDVSNTNEIYKRIVGHFPAAELDLLDLTQKLFTDPKLEIDVALAQESVDEEITERQEIIAASGLDEVALGGVESFADALRECGIEPATKISPQTQLKSYAFAKTDIAMQKLHLHEDPKVVALAAGRAAVKAQGGRAARFVTMGTTGDRKLAVWLNYYGAHTGRWSGGNKMNPQNLKRGGKLRRSILAPEGYVVLVVDSGQIEARTCAWLADETACLDEFRADDAAKASGQVVTEDSYTREATKTFGRLITVDDKDERFVGKVKKLGLQYGMGALHFQTTLASGQMGRKVNLPLTTCFQAVNGYRADNPHIVQLWKLADHWLDWMTRKGATQQLDYRGILTIDPVTQAIWGPSGLPLIFPDLRWNRVEEQYEYWNGKFFTKLYGGKTVENVIQWLARNIVAEQMLAINQRYPVVTMSHDEVVALAPIKEADFALEFMYTEMRKPSAWCQTLPLNCEGGYDRNYSK